MNLKFISENKAQEIVASRNFLLIASALIFALSIFLRSMIDIGPDTGIYLDLGKKIAEGKRYYYDFFESNFPLSFYFYALEYKISEAVGINQIVLSELIINFLALSSILWSAKILAQSNLAKNRAHYNIVIIAYFLGFFLRIGGLLLGEFGTKTSLILLLLYPYFSYSFPREFSFNAKEKIIRGVLMGLMPCIKPHYIIFPLAVEIFYSWQKKSPRALFDLDKLIAALIYISYLLWMLKMTPEFFEMIVPMWLKIYSVYDDKQIFLVNFYRLFAAHIGIFTFIFLFFSRVKPDENDKILIVFFIAAALVFISESAMTIDQSSLFNAVASLCVCKVAFDFFTFDKKIITDNKFILASLFLIPLFDLGIFPTAIFGIGGAINAWWFLVPFLLRNNWRFLSVYFACLVLSIIVIKCCGKWAYLAFNIFVLLILMFFYEQKISAKLSQKNFSSFTVFLIAASISTLLHFYITDIVNTYQRKSEHTFPNKISDMINHYSKKFVSDPDDFSMMFSMGNDLNFSRLNYLEKDNLQKFSTASLLANASQKLMFNISNKDSILVNYYLFDDIKKTVKNPRTKLIFVNNSSNNLNLRDRCLIGSLEYFFLDYEFRKFFLKNFRFENRVIIEREINVKKNTPLIGGENSTVSDRVTKSNKQISNDFEVYVRQ